MVKMFFIITITLTVIINLVAFILEKVYKKKMTKIDE